MAKRNGTKGQTLSNTNPSKTQGEFKWSGNVDSSSSTNRIVNTNPSKTQGELKWSGNVDSSSSTNRIVQWMISFRGTFLLSCWWLSFCSLFYGIFIYIYICIRIVLLSVSVTCGKHLIFSRIWEVLVNTTSLIVYWSACTKPGYWAVMDLC